MKYRVTFHDGPTGNRSKKFDIEAGDMDEAFRIAYQRFPNAREMGFTDATTEEIPTEPSAIGIRFKYSDIRAEKSYSQYLVVKANDEAHAVEFYNRNLKGRSFFQPWPSKPDEKGNCIYGEVAETYFAACPGYDFDATNERRA